MVTYLHISFKNSTHLLSCVHIWARDTFHCEHAGHYSRFYKTNLRRMVQSGILPYLQSHLFSTLNSAQKNPLIKPLTSEVSIGDFLTECSCFQNYDTIPMLTIT